MAIESASPSYWLNESPELAKLSSILNETLDSAKLSLIPNESKDLTSLFDSERIVGFDLSLFATLAGIE
ncbi:hypothetical protein OROGR_031015 [Orobanche gracilis]